MNNFQFAPLAAGLGSEVTFIVVSSAVTAAHGGVLVGAGAGALAGLT